VIPEGAHPVIWAEEWSTPMRWGAYDPELGLDYYRSCHFYIDDWEQIPDLVYGQHAFVTLEAAKAGDKPVWQKPPFPSPSPT
jgi:hypothetical protein